MLEAKLKALRIAAEAGIADVTSRTKEFLHESGWMDDPAASPREPSPPASQPVPSWRSEARAAPGAAADAATAPSWRSEERAAWDQASTAPPAPSGDPATMRLRRTLAAAREQQAAPEAEDADEEAEEEAPESAGAAADDGFAAARAEARAAALEAEMAMLRARYEEARHEASEMREEARQQQAQQQAAQQAQQQAQQEELERLERQRREQQQQKPPAAAAGAAAASSSDADARLCVVCMDGERTHVIVPCGHRCLCWRCAEQYRGFREIPAGDDGSGGGAGKGGKAAKGGVSSAPPPPPPADRRTAPQTCPLCRKEVAGVHQVFE